ncbi:uncharacterized protein SEPMUDRAFT_120405 [Sphaerulina musiva SO2202]|uniref:Uncharacterized protein n=1 Tax=Sphaerulina musiva (strain SO2202) TaxID=692275 RepID=N1QDL6_SPHMS|nr:uncharacterized protein SEPMUDRAFT_120405 [Sphaerulina musiva SO2202]EMF09561.1 hypothetical protein SEPMUDRAFT_120405 [Sphaerulina musiva SO2202]
MGCSSSKPAAKYETYGVTQSARPAKKDKRYGPDDKCQRWADEATRKTGHKWTRNHAGVVYGI